MRGRIVKNLPFYEFTVDIWLIFASTIFLSFTKLWEYISSILVLTFLKKFWQKAKIFSASKQYQKTLLECSVVCKILLNSAWNTLKFHDPNHVTGYILLPHIDNGIFFSLLLFTSQFAVSVLNLIFYCVHFHPCINSNDIRLSKHT